jgi:hypothetical protein
VRFVVLKEQYDVEEEISSEGSDKESCSSAPAPRVEHHKTSGSQESAFPASVSIASLLKAGKLVKPKHTKKATLIFESLIYQLKCG